MATHRRGEDSYDGRGWLCKLFDEEKKKKLERDRWWMTSFVAGLELDT
jgi:hypothetical protein